jgi:hypothetical protein
MTHVAPEQLTQNYLTNLGFAPPQQGARSLSPVVQGTYQIGFGNAVWLEKTDRWTSLNKEGATRELSVLRAAFLADPNTGVIWRTETRDALLCLKASPKHIALLEAEIGKALPKTQTIDRPREGARAHLIFSRSKSGPSFDMSSKTLFGIKAHLAHAAPLPGTRYKNTREVYFWREGCAPGELPIAALPDEWLMQLPLKRGSVVARSGITSIISPRAEYAPRSPYSPLFNGE